MVTHNDGFNIPFGRFTRMHIALQLVKAKKNELLMTIMGNAIHQKEMLHDNSEGLMFTKHFYNQTMHIIFIVN